MYRSQISGILLVAYSCLMALFALLWHFLLPYNGNIENYLMMIKDPNWFAVNMCGWLGTLTGIFALMLFTQRVYKGLAKIGKLGVFLVFVAFLLHFCLVTWELVIFPVLAQTEASEFVISQGLIMKSPMALVVYSLFSLCFSLGFVFLGIALVKLKIYNKIFIIGLMLGAFLYAFAVAFGGYIGLMVFLVYLTGIAHIGIKNLKLKEQNGTDNKAS